MSIQKITLLSVTLLLAEIQFVQGSEHPEHESRPKWKCEATDQFGTTYLSPSATNIYFAQNDALKMCKSESGAPDSCNVSNCWEF